MANSSYLLQKSSGHFFRYQFPKDIKPLVGKSELRYSLRTGNLSLAKSKAMIIAGRIKGIIRSIRKTGMSNLTPEQINTIIKKLIRDELEGDEHDRITNNSPFDLKTYKTDIKANEFSKKLYKTCLVTNRTFFKEDYFQDILEKHDITGVTPESFEFKLLQREVMKAHVHISEEIQKRS